jgi:tripartite-type tricarboxylate transporter receptor subunit TctC
MMIARRSLIAAAAACVAFGLPALSAQAAWPDKQIRMIVPYPPGGGADAVTRLVGQKLSESLGQTVVVENRAGAETQVGSEAIARSAPDGYTFGIVTPAFAINRSLYPKAPFDATKDFTPVAMLATTPFFFVVNASMEADTLDQFLALARKSPGKFSVGGSSSVALLANTLFTKQAGIETLYVPYKGSAPAVTAVASGEVTYALDTVLATRALIDAKKIKPLAITSKQRLPQMNSVPSASETSLKEFEFFTYYGVVGPAGVPADIVTKLNTEIGRILAQPEVRAKIEAMGGFAAPMPADRFANQLKNDFVLYDGLVKAAGLTAPK